MNSSAFALHRAQVFSGEGETIWILDLSITMSMIEICTYSTYWAV